MTDFRPEGIAKSSSTTGTAKFFVTELEVPPALSADLKWIWSTEWSLPAGETMVVPAVPSGCVALMFERNPHYGNLVAAKIVGPMRFAFPWTIAGDGFSFGATFAPGAFYRLWRQPLRDLQDRALSLADHFGPELAGAVLAADSMATRQALLTSFLEGRLASAPPLEDGAALAEAQAAFAYIVTSQACTSLSDLGAHIGVSERSLERMFDRYIGITPKLAIRTIRFQQALAQVMSGQVMNWAELALAMGYADQSHFCRDFVALTGRKPSEVSAEGAAGGNVQYPPSGLR